MLFFLTINKLASNILFHSHLFFVDNNFDMPYDERCDENCGDVVTDINENLESQAVGNGEITLNMNDDIEQ